MKHAIVLILESCFYHTFSSFNFVLGLVGLKKVRVGGAKKVRVSFKVSFVVRVSFLVREN